MPQIENVLTWRGHASLFRCTGCPAARALASGSVLFSVPSHFLETYLASILYVSLPFDIVSSPGSTVLFTGKLMMLMLLYIREDAVVVRQPIYGLLFGNVLLFALALVMRHHTLVPLAPGRAADFAFLNEMGALMVWGTAILFFDCILIILLYERSRTWFGDQIFPRLALCGTGADVRSGRILRGSAHAYRRRSGRAGRRVVRQDGCGCALYGPCRVYLVYFERPLRRRTDAPRIWDVFDTLTYRERYENLLARTGCDALTGALERQSLEVHGRRAVEHAAAAGRPLALLLIDIDHFKAFNDRYGHAAGDTILKRIVLDVMATTRMSNFTYRFRRRGIRRYCRRSQCRRCMGAGRAHAPPRCQLRRRRGGCAPDGQHRHRQLHARRQRLRNAI